MTYDINVYLQRQSLTEAKVKKKTKVREKSTAGRTIDVLSDKWHNSIVNNISFLPSCHF